MKENITKWYQLGLWSAEMVEDAVKMGVLSQAEYNEIVQEA